MASHDHELLRQWLSLTIMYVDDNPKPLLPAVQAFQDLIESDAIVFMHASSMFEQVPLESPYDKDPLGRPQPRCYKHMLQVLNHVMTSAPKWDTSVHKMGWIGFPIKVVLNWPMSTPSGKAFFLNEKVNAALKRILDAWGEYLRSPASTNVLSTEDGWLSATALEALVDEASAGATEPLTFEQMFVCDPSLPFYGFTSWDDFFTRKFRPEARPVASPDDAADSTTAPDPRCIIVNGCESRPYRLASNVAKRDHFWLKGQPYSLTDMLANDEYTDRFVGGTVFQAFLSSLSYHRWHSPVSGTVVKTYVVPGTYFSKALSQGFGSIHTSLRPSQAYLAEVATRAIIFIEADNPDIGLVCVMPVGMAEVSTCEITVSEGQQVCKGEELGMFHFGGSTYCLIFRPDVDLDWVPAARMVPPAGEEQKVIPLNSQLAVARSRVG
ncbi:MAG: hypothetical protein M1840_000865 [Geoglossum simile]|nr:MAG: hypothetical protein M1840_000865 [Geoglossum simile]